jgi:methionyl-tRNA formyltransferase
MKINILLDTSDSFLHDYVHDLIEKLKERGHEVCFCEDHRKIKTGDMLFLLACKTILKKEHLSLNTNNLVIHPSKLPEGRGSGALVWKILEGENKIYLTLFEANEKIDQGYIYLKESIEFEGFELSDEIRHKQALKTMGLVLKYVDHHKNLKAQKQQGKGSFYRKRTPEDSELVLDKTIREQFNLLRVVDNNRYPAFFKLNGHKYTVKIVRDEKVQDDEN